MRVEPSLQGQGIGRAMLGALEQRARELGYRTLRLDTHYTASSSAAPVREKQLPRGRSW